MATMLSLTLPLTGPGGEPVNLQRTLVAHGVTALPPAVVDEAAATLETALLLPGIGVRRVRIEPDGSAARITGWELADTPENRQALTAAARWLLRLETDLSPFYRLVDADPDLAWVSATGAGRMARCHTLFEDVIKTILTTNCAWSATIRMVTALVNELGEPAPNSEGEREWRAFPTPEAMAARDEPFYREVIRCGYRAKSLRAVSERVSSGAIDLEAIPRATPDELSDDDMRAQLLALPGIGPYAAAHVMMMVGRPSRLVLDSWTRPAYARLSGADATDAEIDARFAPYGRYAGLAFWLYLTRDWIAEASAPLEEGQ